jgi:hypothetical protein
MAQIDLGFEFRRSNKKPVDVSSVWDSLEDAQNYAAGLDGTKGASYAGQIIAVLEGGEYHGYIIEEDGSLKPLGEGGGGITIDDIVSDDGSINITEGQDNVLHMTVSKILNPEIEIPIS